MNLSIYNAGKTNIYVGLSYHPPSASNGNQQWVTAWTQVPTNVDNGNVNFYTAWPGSSPGFIMPAAPVNTNGYAFWTEIPINYQPPTAGTIYTNPSALNPIYFNGVDNIWDFNYSLGGTIYNALDSTQASGLTTTVITSGTYS
jgi:hypothetical protein